MSTALLPELESEVPSRGHEPVFDVDETDLELVLRVEVPGSEPRRFYELHVPKEQKRRSCEPAGRVHGFHPDATPC
jgi:hypothetical protein